MRLMFAHTATIRRNAALGTNGRHQMADVHTNVPCLALPMNNTAAVENGFEVGRAYDLYFEDGTDVKPGDKAVISTGITITIGVVQPFVGLAFVSHVKTMGEQEVA